ncbi:hypothetical protein ACTMU2_29165 [Cupriavidus basilensis]
MPPRFADALHEADIDADPGDERLQRWAGEGASPADVAKAIGEARARRRDGRLHAAGQRRVGRR